MFSHSCSKCVIDEYSFKDGKEEVVTKYSDFDKYHPIWSLLSENLSNGPKVREHIFAKYQKELVQIYTHSKCCIQMPQEYHHELKVLHGELENVLGRFNH